MAERRCVDDARFVGRIDISCPQEGRQEELREVPMTSRVLEIQFSTRYHQEANVLTVANWISYPSELIMPIGGVIIPLASIQDRLYSLKGRNLRVVE